MKVFFTLFAVPTTKKNSGTIAGFGKPCYACRRPPFSKVVPSPQFQEFEKACLMQGARLRDAIERAGGVDLPISCPVSIRALIYRDAETGDWNGYTDAIADVLQQPMYTVRCRTAGCVTPKGKQPTRVTVTFDQLRHGAEVQCGRCKAKFQAGAFGAEVSREGLGIIADDKLIRDWDGTRLLKDPVKPRIELEIEVLEPGLFGGKN